MIGSYIRTNDASHLWQVHEWETAFFGVKTARIAVTRLDGALLRCILAECRACGVHVVHYLADADDDESVRAAEQAGFHLVDVRLTFEWRASPLPRALSGCTIREYCEDDLPALQEIARTSYRQTRFYYDYHYPRERCDALYVAWITRSCQGGAARVIVAECDGVAAGFVTCEIGTGAAEGIVGLVGVSALARGQGIGSIMITEAQRWFSEQGAQRVTVVTQARNISAQRLYQRCGFVTSAVGFWYHKWLE